MKKRYLKALLPALFMFLLHWFILLLAYSAWRIGSGHSMSGFFRMLYDRFAVAGDIPHYINIASNGYTAVGENANEIVFFPLFPWLMRFMHLLISDYVVCGVLVSCICMFFANLFFFLLTEQQYDRTRAWEASVLLTCFPSAFFMCGAYTESLFIMLTAMNLYFLYRENWITVGITGLLAALSRSQGIVLLVPAVYEICLKLQRKELRPSMLCTIMIPLGTFVYLCMNKHIYGDWCAFLAFQAAPPWYNTSHWISMNLTTQYGLASSQGFLSFIIYWPQIILYFACTGLIFLGLKREIRTSLLAYGGAYIFMTYLHGWMISGLRYMLSCLPIYIILCSNKQEGLRRALLIFSAVLAVFFSMLYLQGQALM